MAKNDNLGDLLLSVANAIRAKKGTSGTINPQNFDSEIASIVGDRETMLIAPLPATAITLSMKSGTTNVSVNNHIKIYDAYHREWTVEEWHAKAVENNFDKTKRAEPIGLAMRVAGEEFVWYFKCKYRDADRTYYDVSGTAAQSDGRLRHSQWQHPLITGNYTKTDLNGTIATATLSNGTITLSTTNSPLTWTMKSGCGTVNAFDAANRLDRHNSLISQTEWFRHRAAIDSGLTSTEVDGTSGVVTILNASGAQASVGEDMYFYVNGTNTNILAKYNIHSEMNGDNPTSAIIDAIYNKQKENGVNMNDTGVNSASRKVLTEGSKGAEAYAFNGKWMIVTPILTRANASLTMDYNMPDAPSVMYSEYLRTYYTAQGITMPDERMLQGYRVNRTTIINSIISYLNHAQGEVWGIPASIDTDCWSVVRYYANYAWYVYLNVGLMYTYGVSNRCAGAGVSAL